MSDTLNKCKAEYEKDPNIIPEDICCLQEWLIKDKPNLPSTTDYSIIQFYHACEYSLDQTQRVLELYYNYRHEAPELFTGKDFAPPEYEHSFWDVAYCFDLPKPSLKGYRGFYISLKDKDFKKYNVPIFSAILIKSVLTLILEQGICPGYSIVIDFEGFSALHFGALSVNLKQIKKLVYLSQELSQMRMKEIHLISGGGDIIDKFLKLLEPFLKKTVFDAIQVHSNVQALSDHFGKDNIPKDVGGELQETRDDLTRNFKNRFDLLSDEAQAELKRCTDPPRQGLFYSLCR